MAYKENQTIEIEMHDHKLNVVCDMDWNGRPSTSDVYLKSVNGMPVYFLDESICDKLSDEILSHLWQDTIAERESQDEARADELYRGN